MSFERVRFIAIEEIRSVIAVVSSSEMGKLCKAVEDAKTVFVAGAGRSGLAMRGFAMRLMHLGKPAYAVGDVTTPALLPGDLLVIGSGSGRTSGLVAVAEQARNHGGEVALLTIDADSPIARIASTIVRVPTPSPKLVVGPLLRSAQPLATLFEQSLGVLLDSCVLLLMEEGGISEQRMSERHSNLE